MHHPKLLRFNTVQAAMIPAALLCLAVSGCAEQQPTTPALAPVARSVNVPFNKFFVAWSETYSAGPVQTQQFTLDSRQNRQYADYADETTLSFARANPGRLYIHRDEPDQYCVAPADYAIFYHDFVVGLRGADPTARVSPAGFAEPNDRCCPPPVDEPCRQRVHSIGYAEQFYNAYIKNYGVAPPVNEWRFHDFGISFAAGDVSGWWSRVDREAAWSVAHGANMVLGTWGFTNWVEPESTFQEHMKQVIGLISNDTRINEAVYWARDAQIYARHYLINGDGSLTSAGETFVNPLTDVPTDVTAIADSAAGVAKLQWSNTTYAWAAEVEFWVQASGSNSFIYKNTERVAGPGAVQTASNVFNIGDNVKGRVRYYNAYGQAAWSPFSNGVSMKSGGDAANKKPWKTPLVCFLSKRIQSKPCN